MVTECITHSIALLTNYPPYTPVVAICKHFQLSVLILIIFYRELR